MLCRLICSSSLMSLLFKLLISPLLVKSAYPTRGFSGGVLILELLRRRRKDVPRPAPSKRSISKRSDASNLPLRRSDEGEKDILPDDDFAGTGGVICCMWVNAGDCGSAEGAMFVKFCLEETGVKGD